MSTKRLFLGVLVIFIGMGMLFGVNILRYVIPLAVVYLGVRLIVGSGSESDGSTSFGKSQNSEDTIEQLAIFSEIKSKNLSDNFKGGSVVAIFGGGEIDLTEAKSSQEKFQLDLVAIFGGIKVRVPQNWHVNSEGVGILGSFNNNTTREDKIASTVKIEGVSIFGAVEVMN